MMLELAQDRGKQQLPHLEPLVGLSRQLDQLEHSMRFVSETRESGTSSRPDHRDVMAQPPHLVLHQLPVLRAQPVLVAMQKVAELDVVKTSVVALRTRRQEDAHGAIRCAPQAGS